MQLHRLIDISKEIGNIFKQNELLKKYNNIVNYCQELANNANNEEIKNQLLLEKSEIIEIHNQIEPLLWHDLSFDCLHSAREQQLLGRDFISKINHILANNNTNYSRMTEEVTIVSDQSKKWLQEVEDFIQNSKGWNARLPEYLTNNENKCSIKIFFTNNTFIKTLQELERNTRIWNNIFNAFVQLAEHSTQELYVYTIEQGFLIIKAPCKVTEAFASAIVEILASHHKLLEIRKIRIDLDSLNLNNQQEIEKLLNNETVIQVDQTAYELSNQLVENYLNDNRNKKEITDNISVSIKQIMNFIEKGGRLDIDCLENKEVVTKKTDIINLFSRITELEEDMIKEDFVKQSSVLSS